MKKVLLLICIIFSSTVVLAQKVYTVSCTKVEQYQHIGEENKLVNTKILKSIITIDEKNKIATLTVGNAETIFAEIKSIVRKNELIKVDLKNGNILIIFSDMIVLGTPGDDVLIVFNVDRATYE